MALLLVHIDSHRLGRANVLEHQRPHDLGIIENVIDWMEVFCSKKILPSNSCPQALKKLLAIEADAADGSNYFARGEDSATENGEHEIGREVYSLKLSVPFFGTIRIVREGLKRHQLPSQDLDSV
jgi:hypothetical protein